MGLPLLCLALSEEKILNELPLPLPQVSWAGAWTGTRLLPDFGQIGDFKVRKAFKALDGECAKETTAGHDVSRKGGGERKGVVENEEAEGGGRRDVTGWRKQTVLL